MLSSVSRLAAKFLYLILLRIFCVVSPQFPLESNGYDSVFNIITMWNPSSGQKFRLGYWCPINLLSMV